METSATQMSNGKATDLKSKMDNSFQKDSSFPKKTLNTVSSPSSKSSLTNDMADSHDAQASELQGKQSDLNSKPEHKDQEQSMESSKEKSPENSTEKTEAPWIEELKTQAQNLDKTVRSALQQKPVIIALCAVGLGLAGFAVKKILDARKIA